VPEDRHARGFVPYLGVGENLTLGMLDRLSRWGIVSRSSSDSVAVGLVEQLGIVSSGLEQQVGQLSGGNQQKVVVGRALARHPTVLVAVSPTVGVDVAAKESLLNVIGAARDGGTAVLLVSDDLERLGEAVDAYTRWIEGDAGLRVVIPCPAGAESELESVRAENARLLTWKENREEADLVAEVSVAYETHRETKKLKPDNKTAMLTLLRANPEAFRQLYPATPLAYRHLLQTIAATERQSYQQPAPRVAADIAPPIEAAPIRMSVRQLARQIQVKRNCPLGVAQQEAGRMLAAEKRRRVG